MWDEPLSQLPTPTLQRAGVFQREYLGGLTCDPDGELRQMAIAYLQDITEELARRSETRLAGVATRSRT